VLILKNLPDAQTDDHLANKLGLSKVLAIAFETKPLETSSFTSFGILRVTRT